MLNSSRDILNIALASSALILTFFVAWLLWYFIKIMRDIESTVRSVTSVVEKLSGLIEVTKNKISDVGALVSALVRGGEKVADMVSKVRSRTEEKQNPKQKKGAR